VLFVPGKEDVQKGILREKINMRRSEIKQGEKRKAKGKTKKKERKEKVKERKHRMWGLDIILGFPTAVYMKNPSFVCDTV